MDDVPDASSSDETIVRAPGTWTTPSPAQPSAEFLDAEMHRLLRFAEERRRPAAASATSTTTGASNRSSRSRRGSARG